ncbi:S8 family serine peptidase [Microbacterium rhizophilus]|uniref:S8 family serine peptidase n=1 Tax=Microbacterium rhizophilus TaxID=3138934 RepID=UPI0031EB4D96
MKARGSSSLPRTVRWTALGGLIGLSLLVIAGQGTTIGGRPSSSIGLSASGGEDSVRISFTPAPGASQSRILWRRTDLTAPGTSIQSNAPAHLDRIDGGSAMNGTYAWTWNGSGVRMYFIDSGINGSEAQLSGRIAPGFSLGPTAYDADPIPHGTEAAKLAAGTVAGVAKGATVVSVSVYDDPGAEGGAGIGAATLEACVDFILADHASSGAPAVVSASLELAGMQEGGADDPGVAAQIARLLDAGIPLVIAAGDGDVDVDARLADADPRIIWTSSSSTEDARVSDKPYGQVVTVYAPWETTSGTAPQVSGVVAKILQANPALGPTRIKEVIVSQSRPVVTDVPDGANLRLNADAQTSEWSTSPARSGSVELGELATDATYEIAGQSMIEGVWSAQTAPVTVSTRAG